MGGIFNHAQLDLCFHRTFEIQTQYFFPIPSSQFTLVHSDSSARWTELASGLMSRRERLIEYTSLYIIPKHIHTELDG